MENTDATGLLGLQIQVTHMGYQKKKQTFWSCNSFYVTHFCGFYFLCDVSLFVFFYFISNDNKKYGGSTWGLKGIKRKYLFKKFLPLVWNILEIYWSNSKYVWRKDDLGSMNSLSVYNWSDMTSGEWSMARNVKNCLILNASRASKAADSAKEDQNSSQNEIMSI